MVLEIGDKVYYDKNVYNGFFDFLYDKVHVVTKIEYDATGISKIWTSGDGWSYIPYTGVSELSTSSAELRKAIKLCRDTNWQGSRILFHFV